MEFYLSMSQIIVALLLIISILLQQRGTALGSAFGSEGSFYATRRGVQQKLFAATIVLGIVFVALAFANLMLKNLL